MIPPAIPKPELHKLMFRHSELEAQAIKEYVGSQARDEIVLHLEKVASERIFGRDHDVWDVHTDKERWWVVTEPTNLYSQRLMPSLDYTLSFHIGLMARVAARQSLQVQKRNNNFYSSPIERWCRRARHSIKRTKRRNFKPSACNAGNASLRWCAS